jgi:hypothetical protein
MEWAVTVGVPRIKTAKQPFFAVIAGTVSSVARLFRGDEFLEMGYSCQCNR